MIQKIVKFNSFHVNESNGISFTSWLDLKRLDKVSENEKKNIFCTWIVS